MWSRIDHDEFRERIGRLPQKKRCEGTALLLEIIFRVRRDAGFFDGVELQPGQCVAGTRELAAAANISHQTCRTILSLFKKTSIINTQTNAHGTIITLIDNNGLVIDLKKTNTETNTRLTHDQHTPNTRLTRNTVVTEETIGTKEGGRAPALPESVARLVAIYKSKHTRPPYTNAQRIKQQIPTIQNDLKAFADAVGIDAAERLFAAAFDAMVSEGDPPGSILGVLVRAKKDRRTPTNGKLIRGTPEYEAHKEKILSTIAARDDARERARA